MLYPLSYKGGLVCILTNLEPKHKKIHGIIEDMNIKDIARLRLINQRINGEKFETPAEVVKWMGAMQAQDYPGALWSVGLRTKDATMVDVEKAVSNKEIVRTWPMRGTLHFIPPDDIRWMLKLMTPRIITSAAARHRNLQLDDEIFARSRKILSKALEGGKILTRSEMCEVLERNGIATAGQRGIHIFWVLSQQGLLCYGPHSAKQPTFTLLDEWLPQTKELDREEALATLAKRYFISHGPATLQDFVWWTGLKISDAKIGMDLIKATLQKEIVEDKEYWMASNLPEINDISPTAYLLPGFDEYMLGYRDRSAALEAIHSQKIVPGNNGMFLATIVIDGQIVGTWKKRVRKDTLDITLHPFYSLTSKQMNTIEFAVKRYGTYMRMLARIVS